jgi:hypothetical protein
MGGADADSISGMAMLERDGTTVDPPLPLPIFSTR